MTAPVLALMLMASGFAAPQAKAITHYSWIESRLDHCAHSRLGEGLFGVAGAMRRTAHESAGVGGCIPVSEQIAFMAREWPRLYPVCAKRFAAGDLAAFKRCWGRGHRR